jgi:hypothetical protein
MFHDGEDIREEFMNARIHVPFWLALLGVIILSRPVAPNDDRETSRFAGSYTGKYTFLLPNVEEPQEGVFTSTVDKKGNITAEGTNTTVNQSFKDTGTIDEDGRVKLVIEFSSATYTAVGTASKTRDGHIIATLVQKSGARAMGVFELEAIPKESPKK